MIAFALLPSFTFRSGPLHGLFVAAHASAASPFAVATSSSLSLSRTTLVTSPSRP